MPRKHYVIEDALNATLPIDARNADWYKRLLNYIVEMEQEERDRVMEILDMMGKMVPVFDLDRNEAVLLLKRHPREWAETKREVWLTVMQNRKNQRELREARDAEEIADDSLGQQDSTRVAGGSTI